MISELSGDQMGAYSHQSRSPSRRDSAPLSESISQRSPIAGSPSIFSISTVFSSAENRGCRNTPAGPAGLGSPDRSIQVGWWRLKPAPETVTNTPVSEADATLVLRL